MVYTIMANLSYRYSFYILSSYKYYSKLKRSCVFVKSVCVGVCKGYGIIHFLLNLQYA